MKDLLVHLDDTQSGGARLGLAIDLAEDFGARLTGLHVTPEAEVTTGTSIDRLHRMVNLSARANSLIARRAHEFFDSTMAKTAVQHRWISAKGDVAMQIAAHARYADLVIVGQYERQGDPIHHPLPVCHRVALVSGRPILVVPGTPTTAPAFQRILLAWDGSRECVRAVHDSLPLMKRASVVRMIVVQGGAEQLPPEIVKAERFYEHIRRHGVPIEKQVLLGTGMSVGERLGDVAGGGEFDLLVMGAYSHSDWYEFIFGGTTQSVLLQSPIPLLISH